MASRREKRKEEKRLKKERKKVTYENRPHLLDVKPNEKYVFHSDYFEIDNKFATIMAFFVNKGANVPFPAFWGVEKIPRNLDNDIVVCNFEQVRRLSKSWVDTHQHKTEQVTNKNAEAQAENGTSTTNLEVMTTKQDLEIIAQELMNGASYLNVHDRLLVIAPTLKKLENAVDTIERTYENSVMSGTVWAAAYNGDQRHELSSLFKKNEIKKGKGFYYTSKEFAGEYNLVTHGLEDPNGEYVGQMMGDVNNSVVLFDVNGFRQHVVVASGQTVRVNDTKVSVADMWGSKIAQSCLINNHKVVHLLFGTADLSLLGPDFASITSKVDLNHGDLNMFEMFGKEEDELSVFSSQLEKLVLMAEQLYPTNKDNRSIVQGSLKDVLTDFYIGQRMWVENAKENRDRLRVLGVDHQDIPRLQMFVSYLDVEYKKLVNQRAKDEDRFRAISVLRNTFHELLSANGDLFNVCTSDKIDSVVNSRRVIYDFSDLAERGNGVDMAQLVNIIGYAVRNLGEGDLVVFHGVDDIKDEIKPYINKQFDFLYKRGGRVAFLYNDVTNFLDDIDFNKMHKADYTILGNMSKRELIKYCEKLGNDFSIDKEDGQKSLSSVMPAALSERLTSRSNDISYIRRDFDNVVFYYDLLLKPMSFDKKKKKKRRHKK